MPVKKSHPNIQNKFRSELLNLAPATPRTGSGPRKIPMPSEQPPADRECNPNKPSRTSKPRHPHTGLSCVSLRPMATNPNWQKANHALPTYRDDVPTDRDNRK